jgi:hypothetical protein
MKEKLMILRFSTRNNDPWRLSEVRSPFPIGQNEVLCYRRCRKRPFCAARTVEDSAKCRDGSNGHVIERVREVAGPPMGVLEKDALR